MKRFFTRLMIGAAPPLIFLIITFSTVVLVFNKHANNIMIKQFIIYSIDNNKIFREPNFAYLSKDIHITDLESNFTCAEKHLKLLVLVTSHPGSFTRRKLIRETWGRHLNQHPNYDFRTFFVTGKTNNSEEMNSLKNESNIYKDLVLGNFQEHFYNLSLKVQVGFEWSYKHCSSDFVLKADDDVFINMNSIFQKLLSNDIQKEKLFLGSANIQSWVSRKGKYKVKLEEYEDPFYPDYCGGGAFIFSSDVVKEIIPYMLQNPFKIDDVYIGMLALNAGVKVRYDPNFRLLEDGSCQYYNELMAHHPTKSRTCMMKLFSNMISKNNDSQFVKLHYLGDSKNSINL